MVLVAITRMAGAVVVLTVQAVASLANLRDSTDVVARGLVVMSLLEVGDRV